MRCQSTCFFAILAVFSLLPLWLLSEHGLPKPQSLETRTTSPSASVGQGWGVSFLFETGWFQSVIQCDLVAMVQVSLKSLKDWIKPNSFRGHWMSAQGSENLGSSFYPCSVPGLTGLLVIGLFPFFQLGFFSFWHNICLLFAMFFRDVSVSHRFCHGTWITPAKIGLCCAKS